jgi:DNA-binding HxlR family transcriptional regulator
MTTRTDAQQILNCYRAANVMMAACPSRRVLGHLTSRWGMLVMVALATRPHRFAELRRAVDGVSERMLSQTLKELEGDGMVLRTAHDVVPPHVDYELTPLGSEAAQHLIPLVRWIEGALPRVLAVQAA